MFVLFLLGSQEPGIAVGLIKVQTVREVHATHETRRWHLVIRTVIWKIPRFHSLTLVWKSTGPLKSSAPFCGHDLIGKHLKDLFPSCQPLWAPRHRDTAPLLCSILLQPLCSCLCHWFGVFNGGWHRWYCCSLQAAADPPASAATRTSPAPWLGQGQAACSTKPIPLSGYYFFFPVSTTAALRPCFLLIQHCPHTGLAPSPVALIWFSPRTFSFSLKHSSCPSSSLSPPLGCMCYLIFNLFIFSCVRTQSFITTYLKEARKSELLNMQMLQLCCLSPTSTATFIHAVVGSAEALSSIFLMLTFTPIKFRKLYGMQKQAVILQVVLSELYAWTLVNQKYN